jgi:hypothetical protein
LEQDLSWTPEARMKELSLVDKLFSNEDFTLTRSPELQYKSSDIDMQ